ncbi:GNAT family N-acetyltransferase [Nocardioides sp. R-C-SC26]|uniref:GNAT family N-acetyltransferase n=1 Tax=Nocardioides sp. R-C-SC26 TaxID=2870414 RepID=UPI001E331967|nr:GNAT family N-acetyltransferase [Nocardioides sp. R-C-SC26]
MTTLAPTARLGTQPLLEVRKLLERAFDEFGEEDWDHTLGGLHALVRLDGVLVAHGAVVMRRVLVDGRTLRCGYVESVAVCPTRQRRGLGGRVMEALESLAEGYDLLALSASDAGAALYRQRGWRLWRGPSSSMTPQGLVATPEDDGGIYVLAGRPHQRSRLDLDAPIACDWREGDVW